MAKKFLITGSKHSLSFQLAYLLNDCNILLSSDEQLPNMNSPAFVHEYLKFCLDNAVDIIIPLSIEEGEMLYQNKLLFEEFGIYLLFQKLPGHRIFKNYSIANSFEEFSTKCLEAGYPNYPLMIKEKETNSPICFEVKDSAQYSIFKENSFNQIPFIQLSKFINQKPFKPICIIPVKGKPIFSYVIILESIIKYTYDLSDLQKEAFEKIVSEQKLQGYFYLVFEDENVLYYQQVSL